MYRKLSPFIILCLLLTFLHSPTSLAQANKTAGNYGPRKQLATIVFAGLAGAVLGLSTLSFYGRPQDKLPNIGIGLGAGIIIGTAYTTYQAATRPRDFYGSEYKWDSDWENQTTKFAASPKTSAFQFNYSWDF